MKGYGSWKEGKYRINEEGKIMGGYAVNENKMSIEALEERKEGTG